MKLVFLGTSGAMPTVDRALTCICLVKDNEILMFDAGEGAQISYLKSGLAWNKKMKIFVTHLHGDHCIGILGLLQTMNLQNRTEPIEIFGPDGIDEFLAANIKILKFGLSFPVLISRISTGLIVDEKDYSVFANDANHGIPAFSFRFDEKDRPGEFFPEKAKALGIPEGKLWHELQMGNSIDLDGNEIQSSQVTGGKRPGRKIGVSGDTRPTDGLVEFFKNCDYLSFDSTFADELKDKAVEANHSTSKEAAELAEKANVSTLILTHFSARYHDESVLLEEAQQIHENTIAAKDLLEVDILK